MKLGIHSAILVDYNFEEALRHAHEMGYTAIECCCWPYEPATRRYAGITHIDVDTLDEGRVLQIKQACERYNIEIAALGYYPNPMSPVIGVADKSISHIKKIILAAEKLGVPTVSTFVGKDKNKSVEDNLLEFTRVWPSIIDFATTHKIKIAIENCPMFFSKDEWPGGNNLATAPYIWRQMFSIIDSPYFGLAYDPSHCILQRMDTIKPIYEFKNKIFHVHLKDLCVYQDKLDEYGSFAYPLDYTSNKIPGKGQVDWKAVIDALYDINYTAPIVIEVEDKDYEDSPEDILKACELSYQHCIQFIR